MLGALQSGESNLEALASDAGLEYARHEAITRNSPSPDTMLVQEVFRLQAPAEGETVQAVLSASNGFAVVELDSVSQGELTGEVLLARKQYERVIANNVASQESSALLRQLRVAADIEVFEDRIQ